MRCESLQQMEDGRLLSPSAERNKAPIADALDRLLPAAGDVLEISSGTGQHVVHFARRMPRLIWQPTEQDEECLQSINAWREAEALSNVRAPLLLDVLDQAWPTARADAIICLNMIHIAPWSATQALLRGASRTLPRGGLIVLYGPFRRQGVHTAESNADFDRQLRARDPQWGVRNFEDVAAVAAGNDFSPGEIVQMPANNLTVSFRKR